MAAEDLYDVTPIPAIDPQGMGLGPAPSAPQAPMLAPSGNPHQKIQDLIALAVSVLGGHQTTGFGTGMLNENRRLEQAQTQKNAIAQHQYQQQQTDYEQQQRLYQGEQDKRSQILQQNIQSLRKTVPTLKSQAQYDQFVETYANGLKGMGYRGVDANFLRSAAPYVAPTAQQRASKALDDVLSSPLTKAALTSNPERVFGGKVQFDANGDGVPEDYYVHELAALAGRPIVKDEQGQPIIPDAKDGKIGTAFQEVMANDLATFKAVNHRDPTSQERATITEKAIVKSKEKPEVETTPINADDVTSTAQSILAHRMAPSQLSLVGGMGQAGVKFKQAVMGAVLKQDPSFNFAEAESNFQFGKNTGTQTSVRMIDNINESIPILLKASDNFARSGIRIINAATLAGKDQFGDTAVSQYNAARLGLADEIAKILSGGGTGSTTSDAKLKQANTLLGADMTPGQLRATVAEVQTLLANRRKSLTKGTFMETTAPQTPQTAPARGPAGPPQMGDRRLFGDQLGEWDGKGWKAVH